MRGFIVVLLVAVVCFGVIEWDMAHFHAPGPALRPAVILIVPGESVGAISQELADAGAISYTQLFEADIRIRGQASALKAGEYAIPAHASFADIASILVSGKSIQHKITAAEGLTSRMIYTLVKNDSELVGDPGPVPAEGSLLPETYLFTHGTSRAQILMRMREAQAKFIDAHWPMRAASLPFNSPESALILASIVEKETAIPAERSHIAAVFINRLKRGMKLQSDPTIIYGLTGGYPLGHGIKESELDRPTPYNTYVIDGLPPTPICNPGKDAISAVFEPDGSKDLYFVADGTGGHVFSDTIAEHQRNVAKWRRIESGRN